MKEAKEKSSQPSARKKGSFAFMYTSFPDKTMPHSKVVCFSFPDEHPTVVTVHESLAKGLLALLQRLQAKDKVYDLIVKGFDEQNTEEFTLEWSSMFEDFVDSYEEQD